MKKIRKTLAVCLTASVLAASSAVSASAAAFSDVSGHWAEPTINQWVDRGYINGYPDGTFKPNHPITRTEFALVINRAFHFQNTSAIYFPDVSQTFWGYGEIQKAYAAGYMKGDANGTFRPNANVTRQEAAIVLANIKGLSFSGSAPYYSDSNSISSWARGSVNAVSAAGYMSGYPNGTFAPRDSLTRAQAVTMLNKAMNTGGTTTNPYVPPAQSTTDSVQNMTLQNTTLRNTIVNGDLTIPSSMSSRSITLDNVTVRGKLNLEGGGTITAEDCVINELVMDKSSAVFRAEDGTSVAKTTFRANGTLEGDRFQDVSVANSKVNTVTIDAEVENLTLDTDADMRLYGGAEIETFEITKNADDALIELSRGARVRNMNIRDGVRIAGDGDIDNMTVYVSGVRSEIEPDSLSRRSGAGKPDFDWEYNGKRHESSGSSSSSSSSTSKTISNNFDGNGGKYKNVRITDDAKVKDMRITGNLTIDEDVENGTVRLVDLEIDGDVYVYGGGKNSVIFENCEIDGDIISDKDSSASKSQTVALEFDSRTIVRGEIRILNDTILRESSGSPELNNVVVEKKGVELEVDIDIDTLELEKSAEVNIRNGVKIDTLKIDSGISGTPVIDMDGSSVIKTVDARSDVDIRGTGTVNNIKEGSGAKVDLGSGIKNEPEQPSKPGSVTSVTLDKNTGEVAVKGTPLKLTATVSVPEGSTAAKTVTWKSSDETKAKVASDGTVTGVAVTESNNPVKITATSTADPTKWATCQITVVAEGTVIPPDTEDPDAPVTVPTLSPGAMSVQVGAKATLTLKLPEKFEDYQAIDWAVSGDADTVVLDEAQGPAETVRKLSALKAGKATVTATIKKSAGGAAIASASCDITVTANSSGTAALQGVSIGRSINGQAVTGVNIKIGTNTNQLVALLNPSDAGYSSIMWSSDDPTVVEPNLKDLTNIKSTYLNAKKEGTAIITLTVMPKNADENTPGKTATCEVTVSETGEPIAVTGLTLSPPALSLQVGSATNATGKLTATVAPLTATNKAVVWSSNKEDVATVSQDGTVTAVGAGTATILAKTTDGGFERACTVTVDAAAATIPVEDITLKYNDSAVPEGGIEVKAGGSETLTATVVPPTATNKGVRWSSSSDDIAGVVNGVVTGQKIGTATITATTEEGNKSASCAVKVNPGVTIGNPSSMDIEPLSEVTFSYTITGCTTPAVNVERITKNGTAETLANWSADVNTTERTVTLHVPEGADGTYIMELNVHENEYSTVATRDFTVKGSGAEPPSGNVTITLPERTEIEMLPTGKATLTPTTVTQGAQVTWSSGTPDVARVDANSGEITAVKPGVTTITATASKDGKTAEDTCEVTIKPGLVITYEGVDENDKIPQAKPGEEITFKAQVKPTDADPDYHIAEKVTNRSTGESASWTDGDGLLRWGQIVESGNADLTLSIPDTATEGDYTLTVTVVPDGMTGAEANALKTEKTIDFKVLPKTSQTTTVTIKDISDKSTAPGGTVEYTYEVNPESAAVAFKFTLTYGSEVLEDTDWKNSPVDDRQQGKIIVNVPSDAPPGAYTLKVENDEGSNATITPSNLSFTVTEATVPVTGVTLSEETLELKMGASETLTATTNPSGKTVTWTSNKLDVVTVDGHGTVTPVAPGTATITAAVGSQKATCEVTVKPTITIIERGFTIKQGETKTINVEGNPEGNYRIAEGISSNGTTGTGDPPETVKGTNKMFYIKTTPNTRVGKYILTVDRDDGDVQTASDSTEFTVEVADAGTSTGDTPTESSNESQPNAAEQAATQNKVQQSTAPAMSVRQNTVQTVQQQSAPRTFSFIPQREVQSKTTTPVVTVEPEQKQEAVKEPEKEPEKAQEPEKEPVQEPVKEPETAQEPEKTPEEVQEPEKTPEQTQGIALTCADSFKAGETLTLSGTVNGVSGALRKIDWSIRDAGATGAAIRDGVMSAEQAGTVTVAATVQNSTTTEIFTITVLPGDEPKADEPIAQEPAETEPQIPVPGVQPEIPAEGQAPAVTAPAVQTGAVTLPNGQVIPNAKKYQRSVGTIIALSGLDALPANAAADSVVWKAESLGTTGAALQMQDNTLVSVNANTAGVILLSRTVKVTNTDGSAAIMTTYYEITVA